MNRTTDGAGTDGTVPDTDDGLAVGAGQGSTFEPEEDAGTTDDAVDAADPNFETEPENDELNAGGHS